MRITSRLLLGAALGLMLVVSVVPGRADRAVAEDKKDDKQPRLSPAMMKPLKAAQDALQAKNYPDALQHLQEAQAVPNKTPYDELTTNEMLFQAYVRTNDYEHAEPVLEAIVGSSALPPAELAANLRILVQLTFQLKQYDKAIANGEKALTETPNDDELHNLVDHAYYLKGDYAGALKSVQGYIDTTVKKGQAPAQDRLNLMQSTCVKLNDSACITRALELLVAYHPTQEAWENLIAIQLQTPEQSDRILLQTYRLALDVDVLKRPESYTEMAQLALEQGSPGEAETAIERGLHKNVFTEARSKELAAHLLDTAKKQVAADKPTLSRVAADAEASKTGAKDVAVGLAYLSYQQYDKAVEAFTRGLGKGGVRSEPEARLLLGIAQMHAGKKDDSVATFGQVKGDPKLEHLASLWGLRARQA